MSKIVTALFVTAGLLTAGTVFAADGNGAKDHPRRMEVNHRLENQHQRIHKEVKEGEMSKAKAARLHRADRKIRHEERHMASEHGGHLTKHEQRKLNHQENRISHRIGQ